MYNKFEKFLTKWAIKIFEEDIIEKKLQAAFKKSQKINKLIGIAVWKLILAKQDDYFTKNDFIFEVERFKRG